MQYIEALRFDPTRTSFAWWAQVDSNHRPRAYQARALTTWAMSPFSFLGVSRFLLSPYFVFHLSSSAFRLYPSVWHIFVLSLLQPWQRCPAVRTGGDDGNRTHDPLLAGQVLSQLSYTPISYMRYLYWVPFRSLKIEQQAICTRITLAYLAIRFRFALFPNMITTVSDLVISFSIERRWSSRTFRYGYLVTT